MAPKTNKVYKILVVEDEKPMAHAIELKMSNSGFSVSVAFDGAEALSFLEKNDFDVILLDLVMPKVDGFTVLAQLKEKNIKTPVIVMTNLSQQSDVDKAKELGAVDYLVKADTSIAEIVDKVRKLLGV